MYDRNKEILKAIALYNETILLKNKEFNLTFNLDEDAMVFSALFRNSLEKLSLLGEDLHNGIDYSYFEDYVQAITSILKDTESLNPFILSIASDSHFSDFTFSSVDSLIDAISGKSESLDHWFYNLDKGTKLDIFSVDGIDYPSSLKNIYASIFKDIEDLTQEGLVSINNKSYLFEELVWNDGLLEISIKDLKDTYTPDTIAFFSKTTGLWYILYTEQSNTEKYLNDIISLEDLIKLSSIESATLIESEENSLLSFTDLKKVESLILKNAF